MFSLFIKNRFAQGLLLGMMIAFAISFVAAWQNAREQRQKAARLQQSVATLQQQVNELKKFVNEQQTMSVQALQKLTDTLKAANADLQSASSAKVADPVTKPSTRQVNRVEQAIAATKAWPKGFDDKNFGYRAIEIYGLNAQEIKEFWAQWQLLYDLKKAGHVIK